ncbi:hypothetical protein JTB14_036203 [Gonioctena quinquepunctata]|nr:hypothetical protein JTB14_036203 [Gonioctena quinquepunctata]
MSSSQPDSLPNFISLVIEDSLKNRLIFRISESKIHRDRFRGSNAASKKLLRAHKLKQSEIEYSKCCESTFSDEDCVKYLVEKHKKALVTLSRGGVSLSHAISI